MQFGMIQSRRVQGHWEIQDSARRAALRLQSITSPWPSPGLAPHQLEDGLPQGARYR